MSEQARESSVLRRERDRLQTDWLAAYYAVPEGHEVGVDDVRVPGWWRGRGQLAHALRVMKNAGLLTGGRGRFQRVPFDA